MKYSALAASLLGALLTTSAIATEYTIGEPSTLNGMEVAAVYLQPVEMEPEGMMRPAAKSDIHLEADIHATADNVNGLPDGAWVPYLNVKYFLQKVGDKTIQSGDLMPMVASDGPHYGDNVKLSGPGQYRLTFWVGSPDSKHASDHGKHNANHFGRHIDKETGVAPWFKPFELKYDFVYAGTGKKGAY